MKNFLLPLFIAILVLGAATSLYLTLPSDEDEPDESETGTIGYVGCSNTWMSVEGYHTAGGELFWEADSNYGGGNVTTWAEGAEEGNEYWRLLDKHLRDHDNTEAIWWQLCIRETQNPTLEEAESILSAIRERLPEATIYVSAIPGYPDEICPLTSTEGVERSNALRDELLAEHPDLKAGPIIDPMTADKTMPDKCHIKPAARESVGQELRAFFD
jgi:hypothetical protein